ncbi:MAG TPA: response regulator transcription factor [Acidimicrobiia bacterium]|nr:response regulator transcription factor [Acidimicrobiia bacterium]
MSRVLLVEDDALLRRTLRANFRSWDFEVAEAASGEEALTVGANEQLDLVILDLALPGIDGLMTLRHLRSFTDVPVVVLTVRDALSDKVAALESGADDYIVKPFEPSELLARSRAHLRRAGASAPRPAVVHAGDLVVDLARRQVTWAGEPVSLTPTELRLLEVLLANRGKLVTREQLLEQVFASDHASDRGRLRVFVQHLRRKLHDDAARPRLIFTEPGLGYRWIAEDEERELEE